LDSDLFAGKKYAYVGRHSRTVRAEEIITNPYLQAMRHLARLHFMGQGVEKDAEKVNPKP
jgi:hypothetical protein